MQPHEMDKKAMHERMRVLKQDRARNRAEKYAGRAGLPTCRNRPRRCWRARPRATAGGASCARGAATRAGTWWGGTSTYTVHRLPVLLALLAHELYAPCREERAPGRRVAHLDEARVEVDLRGEGADGDERGRADAEDGRDGLVEEALVAVGGLFQDQNVAARAFRRPDLHKKYGGLVCVEGSA